MRAIVVGSALTMRVPRQVVFCLLLALAGSVIPASTRAAHGPSPQAARPVIVIGLVGGWIRPDNQFDHIVQLANGLNTRYAPVVHAEIFDNHHRDQALQRIVQLLDADQSGTLDAEEIQNPRVVLYGESWGGSETVTLARELEERGIPVLLTIQIDSVAKIGENDKLTPANVAQAVNFYQPHGIIHGRRQIHAEESSHTKVIGNFRFDYQHRSIPFQGASWFARTFLKPHVSIENDPVVWSQVESLIRSNLPVPEAHDETAANSAFPVQHD